VRERMLAELRAQPSVRLLRLQFRSYGGSSGGLGSRFGDSVLGIWVKFEATVLWLYFKIWGSSGGVGALVPGHSHGSTTVITAIQPKSMGNAEVNYL